MSLIVMLFNVRKRRKRHLELFRGRGTVLCLEEVRVSKAGSDDLRFTPAVSLFLFPTAFVFKAG